MSKRSIILAGLSFLVFACNSSGIKKPSNLIEKDKMVDILYDMSLLDAIKSQRVGGGISNKTASEYVYKKYKIDSIQFAESNKYYAQDVDEYKKMFEKIKDKLDEQNKKLGITPNGQLTPVNLETPQVQ